MDGYSSYVNLDFMLICKQNNIHIVFLPAHSSHVLQPLDLSVFSPLKTRYRRYIADLAYLDDAAPIKKQRFIQCYKLARIEALTLRTIKGGWKAASISLQNTSKGLNSSQIRQPPRPLTPPLQTALASTDVTSTPKSSQQLYRSMQLLYKS